MGSKQIQIDALSALYMYYQDNKSLDERLSRKELTFGWGYREVDSEIVINLCGELVGAKRLGHEELLRPNDPKSKKTVWRGVECILPIAPPRTNGENPGCLCDNYKYVLGLEYNKTSATVVIPKNAQKYHKAFVDVWKELARIAPDSKEIQAVLRFYDRYSSADLLNNTELRDVVSVSRFAIFRIAGSKALHMIPDVVDAVNTRINRGYQFNDENNSHCICRFSGKEDVVCKIWYPWSGIVEGGSFGLVPTYYKPASAERWGYEQGDNALVGVHSEWAIYTSWCELSKNSVTLNNTTYVFWTENGYTPDVVKGLFQAVKTRGAYDEDVEANDPNCYVLGVQKAGNRGFFVKTFLYDKLSAFDKHIRFFQSIAQWCGFKPDEIKLWKIVCACNEYRDVPQNGMKWDKFNNKRIQHNQIGDELVNLVCTGKPLCLSWLNNVVAKYMQLVKKGYVSSYESMRWLSVLMVYALFKADQHEAQNNGGITMDELLENEKKLVWENDGSWMLGRLIACVNRMQELAVFDGKSNKGTIYKRILVRACNNPMGAISALGEWYETIYRPTALGKGGKIGAFAFRVNKLCQEVIGHLNEVKFPIRLSLEDRAKMFLGFGFQTDAFFKSSKQDEEADTKT